MAAAPAATTAGTYPQPQNSSRIGEPVWDVALWYPPQGHWTEDDYLSLVSGQNWMVEFDHGVVEFLPMPTPRHYRLSRYLIKKLESAAKGVGEILAAPTPILLWSDKYREPDIFFCRPGRIPDPDKAPEGADLAIEIVSEGKEQRERDLVTKRKEYARAKIDEYWIVDPEEQSITVLIRDGRTYKLHGTFVSGQQATSLTLPGFTVDVTAVFAAGEGKSAKAAKKPRRKAKGNKRQPRREA